MPSHSTRRQFLFLVGAATTTVGTTSWAQVRLDPKDPQASALGYVDDATKADAKRFPQYKAGQACAGCALFQGKPADAAGPCALFPGKQVSAKGWCSAWSKKAA
ncbi:high-potential iron-sulfur protein [soil metagenome]